MFRRTITKTPLASVDADTFFVNIYGDTFNGDVSFISTLRALIYPRMQAEDSLYLSFRSYQHSWESVKQYATPDEYVRGMFHNTLGGTDGNNGIFQIVNFTHYNESENKAVLTAVSENFETAFPQFKRVRKITDYYAKTFEVQAYVDEESKNVAVFTENMDIRKMHYLQCAIFPMLPWYFADKTISQLELDLINSLRSKDESDYIRIIGEFSVNYDLRKAKITRLLQGFESNVEKREAINLKGQIESCERDMNSFMERFRDVLTRRKEIERRLFALELAIEQNSENSEIMDYFLCNKSVVLETTNGDYMEFGTKGYLEFFDEDLAETVIKNKRSYVYKPDHNDYSNIISNDDMEMLMSALFIDKKIKMRMCSAYRITLGRGVSGLSHFDYSSDYEGYAPNPHIDRYSCMGDYERVIYELVEAGNYVMAIEQCIASAKSLNFGDSCVMAEFMQRMYGMSTDNRKIMRCIELPDGTIVDPKEAIEWLKEQSKQEVAEDGEENQD